MALSVNLKIAGLYTLPSELGSVPEGALSEADNLVIDRENVAEPRRGFDLYGGSFGTAGQRADQLFSYKGTTLLNYSSKLAYESTSGTFTDFSGSYTKPDSAQKMRSVEANGNFYFTSTEGIKKISASASSVLSSTAGFIVNSGGIKALDLSGELVRESGFFPYEAKVAYRVVWGTRDNNNNLILGYPSDRIVLSNVLSESLILDFNSLLNQTDEAAAATTAQLLSETDYLSLLKLPTDGTAAELRTNLLSYATKLDLDLGITEGSVDTATGERSGSTVTITFNNPVTGRVKIGDKVRVTGFSGGLEDLNSTTANLYYLVTDVTGSTIKYTTATSGNIASTPETGATVELYNFRSIEEPSALSDNPTFTELTSLLDYYNNIVLELQVSDDPSGRIADTSYFDNSLANDSTKVSLTFTIPREITTSNTGNYFYQVYRTEVRQGSGPVALSDIDPGDEMGLVLEDNATSAQVTAGFVTVTDETPDSLRGTNLYTNPNSGEGILQANEAPPVAKDMALFKGSVFYANTRTKHKKQLTLLGTSNLTKAVTGTISSATVASNVGTLTFSAPVTGELSVGDVISLAGFANTAATINAVVELTSVTGASASFALTAADFSTAATADLGSVAKCSTLTLTGASANIYTFVPEYKEQTEVTCAAASTLAATGVADYFLIYGAQDETGYYVYCNVGGGNTDPMVVGKTGIRVDLGVSDTSAQVAQKLYQEIIKYSDFASENTTVVGSVVTIEVSGLGETTNSSDVTTGFGIRTTRHSSGESVTNKYVGISGAATPAQRVDDTAKSLIRIVNRSDDSIVNAYYISGVQEAPGKILFEAVNLNDGPFYFNSSYIEVGESFDPTVPVSGSSVISDNEVIGNRVYYSKTNQPEAVPLLNYFDIGPKDKAIKRILALRDSLFVLKEDGVYRIGGESPINFSSFLFDTSAKILAPDSAVVLNNQIYAWTDQGIVTIGEAGIGVISRQIENKINDLTILSNFKSKCFGVAYDLDRSYLIWVIEKASDTYPSQCYRYNFFTQAWTRWPISKTCGLVSPVDNKLYLGAADTNRIEQERKNLDRTDYSDRSFNTNILLNATNSATISMPSVSGMDVHDTLLQLQYLTIADYNRLLKTVDRDTSVVSASANDYFSSLSATAGVDLQQRTLDLANKLDSDFGTTFATLPAVTAMDNLAPSTLQTGFNAIIAGLNASTAFAFGNYIESEGTKIYEALIEGVDIYQKTITLEQTIPLIVGPAQVYNYYKKTITWAPQYFGNPAPYKHIREGAFIFERNNFKDAKVAFASDILPGFIEFDIFGQGNGTFGNATYGNTYFGGDGSSAPARVLIPQQRQRCRFLRCRFSHENAREKFSLYGAQLVGEASAVEVRAYR